MSVKPKFTASIIGCGKIGCDLQDLNPGFITTHLHAYLNEPGVQLVAVCDSDAQKAHRIAKMHNVAAFSTVQEMMQQTRPQIVSICTPDNTHFSVFQEVVRHDCVKAIWCEKPLAITIRQGREMAKICIRKRIPLSVNHFRRYDPFYDVIRSNLPHLVGTIQNIVCRYSGGITTVGSHIVDMLDAFFGQCKAVTGTSLHAPTEILAHLEYDQNIHAILIPCNKVQHSILEFSILGSAAKLEIFNKPFGDYGYRLFTVEERCLNSTEGKQICPKYIGDRQESPVERNLPRDFFSRALSDLISCIDQGKKPISSVEDGLRTVEVLAALAHSAQQGGATVPLPLAVLDQKIPEQGGDVQSWKS